MHSPITFGKILVAELSNALARVLPPEAYTEIKGTRKKGMTDTKPHFLRERLTEVFGTAGYGWWFEVEEMTSEYVSGNNNPWTSTCRIKFYYRYQEWDGDMYMSSVSEPVPGIGGISMDRKDFSERGAVTNALGDALKQLGWQKGLWFGIYNHNTAKSWYERQAKRDADYAERGEHVPGLPVETKKTPTKTE